MILVKLYTREAGRTTQVGTLEFFGVPVAKSDRSTWIAFDSLGEPRPGQIRLDPAGVATGAEILAEARKKGRRKAKRLPADKLGVRLVKVLERWRQRWSAKELPELARQLREFADQLEKPHKGGKKADKD